MSEELKKWRDEHLNSISSSFCAAKWYNVSLHLGHGFTNSCHLPLPHPIDANEVKTNPSALHNTKIKKDIRKMMLEGKRPAECSYCWKLEDINDTTASDRIYKSKIYTLEDIDKIKKLPTGGDVLPKTIEVSFDRICNFACSYCNAGYSTKWGQDITKNGPYQKFKSVSAGAYQSDGSWADKYGKDNPFSQAFLEWWPELSTTLQEIRVTGGEPMTSPIFWKFLETMKKYPSPDLNLAVNSNLGVSDKLIDKLIKISKKLDINNFDIYTSNESFGEHAEYIRDGLNYELWRNNVVKLIETDNIRQLIVMMTINSLCLSSITEFLDDMLILKEKYGKYALVVDFNILRWPAFMSPISLPTEHKTRLSNKLASWYENHSGNDLFNEHEHSQIKRLIDYMSVVDTGHVTTEMELETHFHDFKSFYEQYDKRRNKDFKKTFPELSEWYDSIKVDTTIPDVKVSDGTITHFEIGEYKPD